MGVTRLMRVTAREVAVITHYAAIRPASGILSRKVKTAGDARREQPFACSPSRD
jgi:hypothetical protein